MKRFLAIIVLLFAGVLAVNGQELYVYSEPASNMPSRSVGLRLSSRFPATSSFKQRYMPEIMLGINKNWMVHVSTTLSDYYSTQLKFESIRGYAKYRFYSNDDVHKHFRMAAFADAALTRNPYLYDEINLEGDNDGMQVGLIATQLVNKLAVSGTAAYTRIFKESIADGHHVSPTLNAVSYSLSAGYLLLPKEYVSYNQPNLNLYMELLGMKSFDNTHYNFDLAPAVQLIFNSNTKINLGYRFQLKGNMARYTDRTWLVGFEHTLFNAWK